MSETFTPETFREYIESLDHSGYSLRQKNGSTMILETEYAEGSIVFHDLNIIELIIVSKKNNENVFYLHFQLNDADHAKSLLDEMIRTLIALKDRQKTKVLLCCTSGLTTSYFAMQLNQAAADLKLDYEFNAINYARLYESGFDYDIILLAPQIQYNFRKVKEIFRRKTVLNIPASVFAGYQTGNVFSMIRSAQDAERNADPQKEAIRSAFDNDYRILCIGLINHFDSYRIGYCIYDHGKRTLNKEVIKNTHSFQDIEDLLDYVLARHENIDAIAIAYPGISWRGRLYHPDASLDNSVNTGRRLEEKYGHHVILINDVNAMALGYHALYEDTDNMAFLFQPRGSYLAGTGIIMNGKLHRGWKSYAGETGRLVPAMTEHAETAIFDPQGALEIVSKQLLALITIAAPEKIVLYSELTPETEEIRKYLSGYIPEEYIPEIIWTDSLKSYLLPGAMIHALEVLRRLRQDPEYYLKLEEEATSRYGLK